MSLKIVFLLAFLAVAFGLPSQLKKPYRVGISKETLQGLQSSSVLKKPLIRIPKETQQVLGQQADEEPSEGLNDELNLADYDEINEELNDEVEGVPSRLKRAVCRNITFRTKSGRTITVRKCSK